VAEIRRAARPVPGKDVLTVVGTLLGGTLVKAFGYKVVPLVAHARHAGAEMLIGGRRQEAADKREAPSPRP
jgi:hypothetical protein